MKKFLFTLILILMVSYLKVLVSPYVSIGTPLLLFFSAIGLSAWFGGFLQGLFGYLLSLFFIFYQFIDPSSALGLPDSGLMGQLIFYTIDCFVISIICAKLRSSHNKIHQTLEEVTSIEQSLIQSEARFRKVYDSNMIGLLFCDFDGNISDANDYFLTMIGYSRKDLDNKSLNWRKITPQEYLPLSLSMAERLRTNPVIPPFEKQYLRPDGTKIWALVGASRISQNSIVSYIMDISERKAAEKALHDARINLEERVIQRTHFIDSVIENIPNMIFVKDARDLRFIRFNKAGEELVGQKSEDLVGRNDYDFFPKEQADFFVQNDRRVLEGKHVLDIPEEPLQTKSGIRFLHTKKIPIFDKNGDPQYLLGISEDITERKEAEKQKIALMQEQAARSAAESSAKRLAILSGATAALNETLDLSEMLSAFAKVATREFSDICVFDFYMDDDNNLERALIMHKGLPIPTDNHRIEADVYKVVHAGQPLKKKRIKIAELEFHSAMVVPLASYGKTFGALTFASQRTDAKYNELDLSIAQDLAKRASLAIENAKLYMRANEASRAKSAFLANMSHEIRTPLGAMLGFAELALEGHQSSKERSDFISTIIRNGHQLLRIVDEILDISKVESERMQIERICFSLPVLLEEVVSLLRVKANEKSLQLNIHLDKLPEFIISDPTRIRQILINVIGNAIKFTHEGEVNVTVYTRGETLSFLVDDTGIGISDEQRHNLFQPFSQADESMTRKFGGTGLGLFLSRKLARLLGGDLILLKSQPDCGSRFQIDIKVGIAKTLRGPKKMKSPLERINSQESALHGSILVVDDSLDNRILVTHYLSHLGLGFDTAENGREGVRKALEGHYDIVLMDVQMPEMDGFQAVQYLREHNYHGPIFALTAHAMKGDRERCLLSGFDEYLCKPLTKAALNQALTPFLPH